MKYYLSVDFGSTYTKICAIDVNNKKVIGTSKAFTTIQSDIREGFNAALGELEAQTGRLEYEERLACSSAGGGLKMIALGLVPELTAKASLMAASSAGAKVTNTYSYELSSREQEEISKSNPDIILLCGGTDGGNREVIIHNAKKIAETEGDFSVIYAGNKTAADEAEHILKKAGKDFVICNNVMPDFNVLDITHAKNAIRSLFIKKIVDAKGLSEIQKQMTREIIPTPLAVFEGAELFSRDIGDLMAVDLGGATTDVYSICDGKPSKPNVIQKGLPEPFAKRSVEGDLGLRYNIDSLAESAIIESATADSVAIEETADQNISKDTIREWVGVCKKNPDIVSEPGSSERNIDEFLARHAVSIAAERHSGTIESIYTPMGQTFIITGKDLSNVPVLIGIGGSIINSTTPKKILEGAVYNASRLTFLKPIKPKFYLDKKYIFASMGLVGKIDPTLAIHIMKQEIIAV